ncbi:MAG: STAS domain-containing protein [Candidatus Xenobia bacterium]
MMDNLLDIQISESELPGGLHRITVTGELDINTSPRLKKTIDVSIDAGRVQLVIDFNGVRYIDSTGLGVLVAAQRRLKDMKGNILLICTNKHILKLFEITGLVKMFEILDSEEGLQGRQAE